MCSVQPNVIGLFEENTQVNNENKEHKIYFIGNNNKITMPKLPSLPLVYAGQ